MGEADEEDASSPRGSSLPSAAAASKQNDNGNSQEFSTSNPNFQTRRDEQSGILICFTLPPPSSGHVVRLAMLACEEQEPYGPPEHTAAMLMNLLVKAAPPSVGVELSVFPVYESSYPSDCDAYQGFIIPGSMSEAYDFDKAWIVQLRRFVQQELVSFPRRKTLGICFGHQIYAHSFSPEGRTQQCPAGFQVGSKAWSPPKSGGGGHLFSSSSLSSSELKLLYTHGDMVTSLPCTAISLGGDGDVVPIVAAAYFASEQDAAAAAAAAKGSEALLKPTAITFQAHPEYATSLESWETILQRVANSPKFSVSPELARDIRGNVRQEALSIQRDNIYVIRRVGELLEWW